MRIRENNQSVIVKFGDVPPGTIFKYGGLVYMKVRPDVTAKEESIGQAVDVSTGYLKTAFNDMDVTRLDAELVVSNYSCDL